MSGELQGRRVAIVATTCARDGDVVRFVGEIVRAGKPDQGLVSSRDPDDLPAFCAEIVEEFAEGADRVAPEGATRPE